ncbi:hypothetical protein DFH09DRAFT_265405 [Mycena vulgaris]|nr:hypothetical protein DFH09DRAFT_265405 [Mycena vulgaris]
MSGKSRFFIMPLNVVSLLSPLPARTLTVPIPSSPSSFFDMFREIKIETAGTEIRFARFMPNGNLRVINADMEAAQVLGAARSFLNTNIPSFSGIATLDPHVLATFFIKSRRRLPVQAKPSTIGQTRIPELNEHLLKVSRARGAWTGILFQRFEPRRPPASFSISTTRCFTGKGATLTVKLVPPKNPVNPTSWGNARRRSRLR